MPNQMMNQLAVTDVGIDEQVAQKLLSHLTEEKDTLEAMLRAVRNVHHALIHLEDKSLQSSLEAEARELKVSVAIQQRRQQFQDQLAAVLGMSPDEITLKNLVMLTSGTVREAIDPIWKSLVEMSAEVDRLNRQNAAMIGQSLSIIRGVVERLTGVSGVGESYGAKGTRADTHVGPIIQWGA